MEPGTQSRLAVPSLVTATAERATERAFGRRAIPDSRDLWYLLDEQELGAPVAASPRRRQQPYDERDRPVGVACALLSALHADPRRIPPSRCPTVEQLDARARRIEGALGRAVTVRAGCRALRELGLISRYLWAYEASEIEQYLEDGRGGLVLGLDWYAGMSRPDADGLIRAWGPPEGGHAVFAWGIDRAANAVLIQNNWGPGWGGWSVRKGRRDFRGCARLPLDDLKKLLADNGEAVALVKHPAAKGTS